MPQPTEMRCLTLGLRRRFSVPQIGKVLVILGIIISITGCLFWSGLAPRWLGRLPGDIRIERGDSAFYFPIVTCIVLSLLLSLIFSLFRR